MNLPIGQYQARDSAYAVTAAGDFFQLRNESTDRRAEVLEIRFGQTTLTSLEILRYAFNIGTNGGGGSALAERSYLSDHPAAACEALSDNTDFTTDVTASTFEYGGVWNVLQEFVWLPTPEIKIILEPGSNLGIALDDAPSGSASMTCNVIWREY